MIKDPVIVRIISDKVVADSELFFISEYDGGECIGIATRTNTNFNGVHYKWFIEMCNGRKSYYDWTGGKSAEDLVGYLEKNYPDNLEWLLFHPEWL